MDSPVPGAPWEETRPDSRARGPVAGHQHLHRGPHSGPPGAGHAQAARKGPQEANRLRREVPTRRIPWNEQELGHFEADLVHHSEPETTGHYLHALQMVNVAIGWSERVALLRRSFRIMRDAFQHILLRLPFPIWEIHPDNGGEFFHHHLLTFWSERITGLTLSRSRPWERNDNRFVEKNDTLVRAYLGYEPLDMVTQAVNTLYEDLWTYYNLFQPAMRLAAKEVVEDERGETHTRRHYDTARPPRSAVEHRGALRAPARGPHPPARGHQPPPVAPMHPRPTGRPVALARGHTWTD